MNDILLNKTICNNLNKYLKGLSMGIQSFDKYIQKSENLELKNLLKSVLELYKNHENIISKRIIDLKYNLNNSQSLLGKITELFQSIKNISIDSDEDVLKEALRSFEFGIEMSEKFLIENILDEKDKSIILKFIYEEKSLKDNFKSLKL